MTLLVVALLGATPPLFSRGHEPIDAGRVPHTTAACVACHREVSAEWAHSRHAQAWTNGLFQFEYRRRPLAWCVHCHAPLREQVEGVARGDATLAHEGVTCAACHIRDGRMLARTRRPGSPHQVVVDADFGGPEFCGGCHEFNFPRLDEAGHLVGDTAHPMQKTLSEYRRHSEADGGCIDCHDSEYGHLYPGAVNASILERAVEMSTCLLTDRQLEVTLTNTGAEHQVPTGGVNRHLLLRVWRSAAPERMFEVFIGRRFEGVLGGGKRTVLDTSLTPDVPQHHRIEMGALGGSPDEPVNVELRYVYSPEGVGPVAVLNGEVGSKVVLHSRLLPPLATHHQCSSISTASGR